MILMVKRDPDGDLRGSLSIPPKIFGGRIGDFVMNVKIPQDAREWIGDVFRSERNKQSGDESMTFPRLEIRTRQETGRLHSDLTFGDRTFHGIGGSVVDLVATMATDPNIPKEIKEWIGDTFWAENEKLKEQAGSLVDERDRLESENGRLKEAIERQTNQILDLQAQITKFKTENGRLIGQLTVYVRENARIERLRIRWRCSVFRMVRAKIPLLKEIARLEDETKQKDDEINTLRAQRDKAQALNVEIQGLKDRIANLQDEAIDSDTLISDLEIKIGEANRQILSLETDNVALRAKLEKVPSTPLEEAHRTIDLLLNRLTQ